jgi:hypothetical protein
MYEKLELVLILKNTIFGVITTFRRNTSPPYSESAVMIEATFNGQHGVISQKIELFITTGVRT